MLKNLLRTLLRSRRLVLGVVSALTAMAICSPAVAQLPGWEPNLTVQQQYTPHRASSYDRSGGNHVPNLPA